MGIVSRIGAWLDKRFPEKLTTDEVREMNQNLKAKIENTFNDLEGKYKAIENRLESEIAELKSDINKLNSDMNSAKIHLKLRTVRVGADPSIQPINGQKS